jgi:hypothetical protein
LLAEVLLLTILCLHFIISVTQGELLAGITKRNGMLGV